MRTTIIITSILLFGLGINAQTYSLSGVVTRADGDPICDVEMQLTSDDGVVWTTQTEADGSYQFDNIPNDNYTLSGSRDANPLNGVSTFDIVMLARHILGVQILSPLQVLGGDVNGSGSFTTLDLIHIRRVVLGIDPAFPVASWRIYASTNGWPNNGNDQLTGLETERMINGLQEDLTDLDFFAIKSGDLNGSPVTICN